MPLDYLEAGPAPIPGYECLQQLGGSPFTSLWSVRAPDGSTRLWKIVDLAVGNAALETRNLELLLRLKHPSLNPFLEYYTLPERRSLILETTAPLKSLRDRLKELKHQATPGIPLHELAPWIMSVADGLDFLNAPQHDFQGKKVAIYHRELKPENMLLFREGGAIVCKVGDFGLAKPVSDQSAQHSQGLANYDYDPPEFYEGTTSPTCDQYSLAICCYELRTGSLPFKGSILEQLTARLNDAPNLSFVESDAEKAVLRRALSKDPSRRFATCRDFARAWIQAMTTADAEKNAPQESPSLRLRRTPPRAPTANGNSPSSHNLRMTPRPGTRADSSDPILATGGVGPSSSMRLLPPRSKVFNPAASDPLATDDGSVATAVDERDENDISAIIRRAVEAAGSAPPEPAPQEAASLRMKRPILAQPQNPILNDDDQKVPMAWVFIISMIVLGAIAVIARELVSKGAPPPAASALRTVDDQRHRAVVDETYPHLSRETPRLY
jgi:serine/threonine protein kinase